MAKALKTLAITATALTLTACSGGGNIFTSWNKPAGSELDEGGFGNPTMNNTQLQNGERSYIIDVNQKFASDVPTTVNFAFNSATLDASAQAILRQQARWILQFPEVHFRVYGHTDLVGTNAYNRALGQRRALAVVRFLVNQGISRDRLEALASFGEEQPLIVTQSPELRNRRTVTEVSGFVGSDPTLLNGKYAAVIFRDYVTSAAPQSTIDGSTFE